MGDGHSSVDAMISSKVWNILVKEGDYVSDGDAVIVLEAMKMEIAVAAKCCGVVTSVCVEKGATVNSGTVLLIIREDTVLEKNRDMSIASLRKSFVQNGMSIRAFIESTCISNETDISIRKLAEERAAMFDVSREEDLPLLGIPFMTAVDSEDAVAKLFHSLGAIHVGCVNDSSSVARVLLNNRCSFVVGDRSYYSCTETGYFQICLTASMLPFDLIASKDVYSLQTILGTVQAITAQTHKEFVVLRPATESGNERDINEELRLLNAASYSGVFPDASILQSLLKELNDPKMSTSGTYAHAVNTMRIVQRMYNALEKVMKRGSVLLFPIDSAEMEEVLFYLLDMLNMSIMKLRNGMVVAAAQEEDMTLVSLALVLA